MPARGWSLPTRLARLDSARLAKAMAKRAGQAGASPASPSEAGRAGGKIAIILGTRPEIIKMSPIIRACEKKGLDYFVLHTGQHYSYEMDKKCLKIWKLKSQSII